MDGTVYRVRLPYRGLTRQFNITEGRNKGTSLSYRTIRDIQGTGYSYTLAVEPDPLYPEDYDAFYEAISAPVDTHIITLPFGQSTITYEAQISSGNDTFLGKRAGTQRWNGLRINFVTIEPQVKRNAE